MKFNDECKQACITQSVEEAKQVIMDCNCKSFCEVYKVSERANPIAIDKAFKELGIVPIEKQDSCAVYVEPKEKFYYKKEFFGGDKDRPILGVPEKIAEDLFKCSVVGFYGDIVEMDLSEDEILKVDSQH